MLTADCYFFAGAGVVGVAGGGAVGPLFMFSMIDDVPFFEAKKVSEMAVSMKTIAHQVVILESRVAVPRGPKAVWLPTPPKVAAMSALLPCCRSTTTIRMAQTITWTVVMRAISIR